MRLYDLLKKTHFFRKSEVVVRLMLSAPILIISHVLQRMLFFIMACTHGLIPFELNWFQNQGEPICDLGSFQFGDFFFPPLISAGPLKKNDCVIS